MLGGIALIFLIAIIAARCRRIASRPLLPEYAGIFPRPELLGAAVIGMLISAMFYQVLHFRHLWALLGIIAVCIGIGRSRPMRALLAALVVTGVLIVAFSRLYLGLHWLTDVVGGALLAALFVILGDGALRMRRRPVWPRRRSSRDQPRAPGVDQPDIRGSRWKSMWRHPFPVRDVTPFRD